VVVRAERPVPGDEREPSGEVHGTARSDAEGRFRIGGLGDFSYLLLAGAPAGFDAPPPVPVKPGEEEVVLRLTACPVEPESPARLSEYERYVSGTVRDLDGLPRSDVVILGRFFNNDPSSGWSFRGWSFRAFPKLDGTFRAGPFPESRVALVALPQSRPDEWAWLGPRTEVDSGAEGVELPFDPGRDVEVVIPDWPAGATGAKATLYLNQYESVEAVVDGTGRVRFEWLPSGLAYAFHAYPGEGDLVAWAEDLRSTGRPIVLPLTEGRTLRGRAVFPPGAHGREITLAGELYTRTEPVGAGGRFELRGVPRIDVEVRFRFRADGALHSRSFPPDEQGDPVYDLTK
jgi:hypothetical protein